MEKNLHRLNPEINEVPRNEIVWKTELLTRYKKDTPLTNDNAPLDHSRSEKLHFDSPYRPASRIIAVSSGVAVDLQGRRVFRSF